MIYTQQAVIYAQNEAEKNMKKTTESENSDGTNGEDKEQEKPGGEEGLNAAGAEYIRIPDRKKAIRYGIVHAVAGDVVLLAGKGHETYQDVMGHRTHMDERELIGQILEEEDAGVICGRDN